MTTVTSFQQVYNQLNSAQQTAVTTIDGPVMVIAGPGTGKTQVLAARIAYILQNSDTNPNSILALTFTESAAKNMRERLVSMIGKTGYYVQIQTFHSFCTDVINSHPEFFSIDRDSQPLSELERFNILQNIIDQGQFKALKPLNAPYFYLKEMVSSLSNLKREGISPDEFAAMVTAEIDDFVAHESELTKGARQQQEKKNAKNQELIQVYQAYQLALRQQQRFDFDDMIAMVVTAFEQEADLLLEYQEHLLYFLVDEYQDTNSAQNQVVDLLASFWGEAANIFVVGDPNQAIYRFQGASLENVIGFTQRYPQATVIHLDQGYRSPQVIYDAAATLIAENQASHHEVLKMPTALVSHHGPGQPIRVFKAPSQTLETVFIAQSIQALAKEGVALHDIAILYRNNADATEMAEALERWGIAYDVDGGNNVLELEHISQLLCLLRVIHSIKQGNEDGLLYEVMQYQWLGLPSLLVMKAARAASKAKVSLYELLLKGYAVFSQHDTQAVTELEFSVLVTFIERLNGWAARDAQVPFPSWFEVVINESGFLPWVLLQPSKIELLNGVNSLFREVKALSISQREFHLANFVKVIETLEAHHLPITLEDLNIAEAAVRLSTVHKAKGQEWRYVFILRCVDGKWGNGRKRELLSLPAGILKHSDMSSKERNEDDRRLFYVAMTRAKDVLTISYPETIVTENRTKEVMPSLFLEEIKTFTQLDESAIARDTVDQAEAHLAHLLQPPQPRIVDDMEKAFFQDMVRGFTLSVSALNTYLRSPSEFVTQYLLKVPTATSPHMAFGTAVHAALEHWFKTWQTSGQQPSVATLLTSFRQHLSQAPLNQADLDARLVYGEEVLSKYAVTLESLAEPPLYIERFFGGHWSKAFLDDISLTGRIDRVDWVDKANNQVRLIDYKTGNPKTVGEIEATTATAPLSDRERALPVTIRGGYKRQLVFYTLLAQLDTQFKAEVAQAVFEFVEADKQSGKLVSRPFTINQSEIDDLKTVIKEVMSEIRSLEFLNYI